MKKTFFVFALVLISVPALAQTPKSEPQTKTADLQPPTGWRKSGSHPENYEIYLDSTVKRSGKASGAIKSKPSATKGGFATMLQGIKPDNYRGKRIRLSGYLKTENVTDYSGFWLRIDDTESGWHLDFDNMQNRPVKGTSDWKKYEVVLDVPDKAGLIGFGVNLSGSGQVWVDDIQLEVVGKDIASTSLPITPEMEAMKKQEEESISKNPEEYKRFLKTYNERNKTLPMLPANLNFED